MDAQTQEVYNALGTMDEMTLRNFATAVNGLAVQDPEQPRCHHFLGKKGLPWPISWLSSDWQRSAPLAPEHQELIFPFRIDLTGFFGKGADARGQGGNIYLN